MSDILLHSAVLDHTNAIKAFVNQRTCFVEPTSAAGYQCNTSLIGYPLKNSTRWTNFTISQCPNITCQWQTYLKPVLRSHPNGFSVCDTSSSKFAAASCSWTVPAGVTCAQFQLWGPGGGSSSICCCGGAPWGPTGSYMLVQMQVTPGHVYCMCAGCAINCCANQNDPGFGSSTWIRGCNLDVCAEAAYPYVCCWSTATQSDSTCLIRLPVRGGDLCSADSCSGWNFCWDTSGDGTYIPHAFGCRTWYVVTPDTSRNQLYYGLPEVYPALCINDSSLAGGACTISGPVFGFENCTCCWQAGNGSIAGSSAGGHCYAASQGYQQIPAVGGWGQFNCSGYGACAGDLGGMGMVCVSWC